MQGIFYPGAQPECDGCPKQLQTEEALVCDKFRVTIIYYYPSCMIENERYANAG